MENRRLINHLQTAIVVIDKDMCVVEANEAFAKRNQQQPGNMSGQKCYKAAYSFDAPCSAKSEKSCSLKEVFSTKLATTRIHHFWIEDHAVVEEVTTTPIIENNGEVQFIIEEFRDITKLLGLKKGIISTCAYCKKVRDENNQWVSFEVYLHNHTGADFSHGICEECNTNLLDEL